MSSLRARTKLATAPSPGANAIELVDTALAFAARREIFTTEEALELLRGVQNKLLRAPGASIAQIVTSAEHSYLETSLVDRSRVVDPLLDMRLALSA